MIKWTIAIMFAGLGVVAIYAAMSRTDHAEAELFGAIERHDHDQLRQAIENGADVNLRAKRSAVSNFLYHDLEEDSLMICVGETPLDYAAKLRCPTCVAILLEHDADPNLLQAYSGGTALWWAAGDGSYDIATQLLAAGADPDLTDDHYPPIFVAIDNPKMLRLLIDAGARADVSDSIGNTPLHHALLNNAPIESVRLLLDAGVDPEIENQSGKSAADWAAEFGRSDRVDLFDRSAESKPQTP